MTKVFIFSGVVMLSKGWISFEFTPTQSLNWRDSSRVRYESASNLILLENSHEWKVIDVKVFEECFKESNISGEWNLTEESCNCDWTIFAQKSLNSGFLKEKLICLIEVDNDDKTR